MLEAPWRAAPAVFRAGSGFHAPPSDIMSTRDRDSRLVGRIRITTNLECNDESMAARAHERGESKDGLHVKLP
eukprot:359195-Pyramimonas_sp.AAC.1